MPILRKEQPLQKRPVVILIYGEPGIGKTSLFNTSINPLLIDFDRGHSRAIYRQDTLVMNSWEDVETEERAGTFKGYSTIGIDTAKAALDDFLMSYVIKKDYKNAKNKLAAYGSIGDEFKIFVSNRRSEDADLVIIAHSKEEKDGDLIKKFPDVTGGSYNLLLRIADQVGYMATRNNKRTLVFDPTDATVGKNVARLPVIEIPNENDPKFKTFLGGIISQVKDSITAISEAQREATEKMERFTGKIEGAETADELTAIIPTLRDLPKIQIDALKQKISAHAQAKGWIWSKEAGKFEEAKQPEQQPVS